MLIEFRNRQIEKVCTNATAARKKYGVDVARRIEQRLGEISASDTVEMMIHFHIGRCHALTGNRQGQYAVDLGHPLRMVFTKEGNAVQVATIEEIVDYH